ncbi:4'-phosphopantetheinyl transferase family protein [Pseudomonas proteolytica]|uniref:Enterobactin synthase component D n=1 Tax=Pseudomonas proteolytica TaxID=219574 RepID=A0AAW5ADL6_9PSED|nr:4'-phosphopantetheinyl transferase superfamily protein [Pseudomonas proteolytica]KAA8702268.1 4'-phosphopantetheinyl transferase superfamily protein [Pseudomonas proteolytica]MCF5060525.1 4'-phosphopantetheinyl transferase superfamily protein [Pseudomonas proteolytica]MCF5103913.1 4'-phosphopantetheinyl transferase superfamily protein [Pseudomonas proteolytica]TWR79891.1 4'-phosphopantetheinyl transferase superfamily protein [Pseudomonas proteolytica]SEE60003.1 enterobactin synthetase compo
MNPIPACCTPLDDHWPLPATLPGTVFLSTRFEPKLLEPGDFQRCAVPPPASIQRSVAKRQAEFLAGRLCARSALQQLEGLDFIPAIGEDRAPVWPSHISGSITHSTGHAAAIVAHKAQWRGLGMDLENLLPLERAERLAGEILTPDEMQRMATGPREQVAQLVTLTFSAKESLFKALYPIVQKRFYFEHAEVVEWSDSGFLRLRLLTDLSSEWCYGKELEGQFAVDDGQLLSLVAIGA